MTFNLLNEPDPPSGKLSLSAAYAFRPNLVLDSTIPHIVPHIVITPPNDSPDDYYTPWLNATSPQSPERLMVPTPPNTLDHSLAWPLPCHSLPPPATDPLAPKPKPVFNTSRFNRFTSSLMRERVSMCNIVTALFKHYQRAVAFAASAAARSLLISQEYVCPVEKPFQWTDPAEPFLKRTNQYRGTIVIDSTSPFTVPHIIINEPPPQDPWVSWNNATNSPQDHGCGRYLVVPNRMVLYTNSPDGSEDHWGSLYPPRGDQIVLIAGFTYPEDMDPSGTLSDSEPGTPCPATPLDDSFCHDETRYGVFHLESPSIQTNPLFSIATDPDANNFLGHIIIDDKPFTDDSSMGFECGNRDREVGERLPSESQPVSPQGNVDEEDELPPFDEWYQSVATRTSYTVVT
ncbi:hypothetical protein AMATHDRAFT_3149 [Amanita thiersii Skay4041]|uniref:Uncharacterized protein n=1 Tax=Amanita thiersii Skay4041 TaxID=703135 RepID=A0A2A9NSQ1_9AGAR|nr:hypothetical protein AMATHDRAFT_3149 [Amanita thiersii Skay4041]